MFVSIVISHLFLSRQTIHYIPCQKAGCMEHPVRIELSNNSLPIVILFVSLQMCFHSCICSFPPLHLFPYLILFRTNPHFIFHLRFPYTSYLLSLSLSLYLSLSTNLPTNNSHFIEYISYIPTENHRQSTISLCN